MHCFTSRTATLAFAFCVSFAVASHTVSAQEWTRFRGPNGSGVSDAVLPASFTSEQFNWKTKLPGIGHSSPVIWGKRVFLLSADPDTAERYVVCLNTDNGEILWKNSYPSEPHHLHARSSYASCTPAVDADRVYVGWSTPKETTLLALKHDGSEAWRLNLGRWQSQHGFGTSPILYDDLVILFNSQQAARLKEGEKPGESAMLAFDRKTGKQVWATPRKSVNVCYSVPCIFKGADGRDQLICCSTGDGLFSLNPLTGAENWALEDAFDKRTVSSPVIAGTLLIGTTGSGGGGNYAVAVRGGSETAQVYKMDKQAPYVPTPVYYQGMMFMWSDKGIVTCLDAASGTQIWQRRVGGNYSGSPICAGGKLYCMDEDGVLVTVAAAKEFELLGKSPLGEASRSTPAVAQGRMYLRTYSHLISVGGK